MWTCAHSRPLWVSPTNSPLRLGVSPAGTSTPTGVFNRGLRLYFLKLEPWVAWSTALPRCSSLSIYVQMWGCGSASCCTACPVHSTIHHLAGSTSQSSPPWLPISAPPTGLDECFFFISLVVGLPCVWIFCQLWLFFVFKLSSFWLCEEVQCVYLSLHLGWKLPFIHFFRKHLLNAYASTFLGTTSVQHEQNRQHLHFRAVFHTLHMQRCAF